MVVLLPRLTGHSGDEVEDEVANTGEASERGEYLLRTRWRSKRPRRGPGCLR